MQLLQEQSQGWGEGGATCEPVRNTNESCRLAAKNVHVKSQSLYNDYHVCAPTLCMLRALEKGGRGKCLVR